MNTFISKFLEKDITVFFLIFVCLLVAFSPVYLFDYFRHDDWAGACWDRISINTHHLFSNSVLKEIRPFTMIFLFYSELFTEYIEGAKFVKIISITILAFSALLTFRWLIQFKFSRIFALFLCITLFTLPPIQIMASTYHYFFMVVPILLSTIYIWLCWDITCKNRDNIKNFIYIVLFIQILTFLTLNAIFVILSLLTALMTSYLYIRHIKNPNDINFNLLMYFMALVIMITSITAYPMSAMYVWFLLTIPLLNLHMFENKVISLNFLLKTIILSISIMILYFLFGKIYAFIFNIDMNYARGMSIASSVDKIFTHSLETLRLSSNLWDIRQYYPSENLFYDYTNLAFIFIFFTFSLFFFLKEISFKYKFIIFILVVAMLLLSISPLIVSKNEATMYRYLISSTPILGILLFWSLYNFYLRFDKFKIINLMAVLTFGATIIFSIYFAYSSIMNHIVKPNLHELNYVYSFLEKNTIPKIEENKKAVIHHITGKSNYTKDRYSLDEYSVSLTIFRWPVLPSIIMYLKQYGISSKSKTCMPIKWEPNHVIFELDWGKLEIFPDKKSIPESSFNPEADVIDMRELENLKN